MLRVFLGGALGVRGFLRCSVNLTQVASLTGITTRGEQLKLKKPFPYWKRYLTEFEALMDITIKRVEEENAKIIVVEGPIASGKSAFMKQLAEEFEMLCMDQPTMDVLYITRSGFDLRTLDDQLPKTVRTFDHKNFCMCPNSPRAGNFQQAMLLLRFSQYIDALTHILNTGQGVVMERSPYSDFVFIEAMYAEGYVHKNVRDYYLQVLEVAKPLILRPHVIIYLDVPLEKVQENIKKRNLSYEVNSPALTPSYLQRLEDGWKNKYLKDARAHSQVLVYDWSQGGDVEIVIEDLEKLNLNPMEVGDDFGLLGDWKTWRRDWRQKRRRYTNQKKTLMKLLLVPGYDFPEILVPSEDIEIREKLYKTKFRAGDFETKVGDRNHRYGPHLYSLKIRDIRCMRQRMPLTLPRQRYTSINQDGTYEWMRNLDSTPIEEAVFMNHVSTCDCFFSDAKEAPGFEYVHGFNPKHGDSIFKTLLGIPTTISRTPTYLLQV